MMKDCFGIEVKEDEIARWNVLIGRDEWTKRWLEDMKTPYENAPVAPDDIFHSRIPVGDISSVDLIMELGSGFGVYARKCLSYARHYVGLDICPLCIACSSYLHRNIPRAVFLHTVYDAPEIAGLEGKVGGMFGVDFFYHQPFDRVSKMLEFSFRMLRSDGWLSIDQVPGFVRTGGPEGGEMGGAWDSFQEKRDDLLSFLSHIGFSSVESKESRFSWGQTLEYLICRKR